VHCAALIVVPESVDDPVRYYQWNVSKSLEMLQHLIRNGCTRLVFSSSGAIYEPDADGSVDEDSAIMPGSPYARTKALCEQMFADIAAATPLRVLSLRYFNPIGADPQLRTGLQVKYPTHALGKIIEAYLAGQPFPVTGTGWPTRDGTGIRDYVHVWDLATAHVAALTRFDQVLGVASSAVINLGTGTGTTVRELLAAFNTVSDRPVTSVDVPPRPGDVVGAFTRSDRARQLLDWEARFSIADGIRDSLRWAAVRDTVLTGG
jgi:UDP-glucose 4-epimerase